MGKTAVIFFSCEKFIAKDKRITDDYLVSWNLSEEVDLVDLLFSKRSHFAEKAKKKKEEGKKKKGEEKAKKEGKKRKKNKKGDPGYDVSKDELWYCLSE